MASFYGNMKNNSRASFIFDKIYPSRAAMEDALYAKDENGINIGDGIFINRYVLVDYHYLLADTLPNDKTLDGYFSQVDTTKITVDTSNFSSFFIREEENDIVSYTKATSASSNEYYSRIVFTDRYELQSNNYTYILTEDTTPSSGKTYYNLIDSEYEVAQLENNTFAQDIEYYEKVLLQTNNLVENPLYAAHRKQDWEAYKASYDCTVWMKIYADGQERYIMVGELNAKAPIMEFIDDAPNCQNGNGHLDQRISTDLNYLYYVPKNWDIILNTYNPDITYPIESDEGHYYQVGPFAKTQDTEIQEGKIYYNLFYEQAELEVGQPLDDNFYYVLTTIEVENEENPSPDTIQVYIRTEDETAQSGIIYYYKVFRKADLSSNNSPDMDSLYEDVGSGSSFNTEVKYPYYNKKGFDKKTQSKVSENGQGIFFTPVTSAQEYPKHIFVHAGMLTKDTYLPNKYFTYIGEKVLVEEGHIFNPNYAYYIKSNNKYNLIYLILDKDGLYKPAKSDSTYYYDAELDNPSMFVKSTIWENNTAYYELTWQFDSEGNKIVEHKNDTYRVDVYFPSLGNAMSDIYDIVYGQPRIVQDKNDGYNNVIGYASQDQVNGFGKIIGYCSQNELNEWTPTDYGSYMTNQSDDYYSLTSSVINNLSPEPNQSTGQIIPVFDLGIIGYCSQEDIAGWTPNENGQYITGLSSVPYNLTAEQIAVLSSTPNGDKIIPVYFTYKDGNYQGAGKTFDLTDDQISSLSPEIMPGSYDIPIYAKDGSNIRPYDDNKIYSGITTPYDNISGKEVSLGWVLTLLKQYLSELRYLSTAGGLQADWSASDASALGYINHKPNLITTYELTTDEYPEEGKYYYQQSIENGEIIFTKVDFETERIIGYVTTDDTMFGTDPYPEASSIVNNVIYYRINGHFYAIPPDNRPEENNANWHENMDSEYLVPVYDLSIPRTVSENPKGSKYFELPKTQSDSAKPTASSVYVRCGANTGYDEHQDYYISDGAGGYTTAVYVQIVATATPTTISAKIIEDGVETEDDNPANETSLAIYSDKYIITSEEIPEQDASTTDQIITQREFKCTAVHDPNPQYSKIGLYYGERQESGEYLYIGKPIKDFSIITTAANNNEPENLLFKALSLNDSNNTKISELNILNDQIIGTSNTRINIETTYMNLGWPVINGLEDNNYQDKFFYAYYSSERTTYPLDAEKFAKDPTKYYIIKTELKEMDEYEIHNIWNSVTID